MALSPPRNQRRAAPEPVESNERAVVWVGIGVWAVLLVAAVVQRSELIDTGRGWWVWTPVYGIALGLLGLRWLSKHRRSPAAPQMPDA